MPLFHLTYSLLDASRTECIHKFGSMTADDDRVDMGDAVTMIGRWSTVGQATGHCICEAANAVALNHWLVKWMSMVTITATPVVDDNDAREIIMGETPSFMVSTYGDTVPSASAPAGNLYLIEYRFFDDSREEGLRTFAALPPEEWTYGNTLLGRWHDLGTGSGIAVCASDSSVDLQRWMHAWMHLCDCKVTPVVTDAEFRENVLATCPPLDAEDEDADDADDEDAEATDPAVPSLTPPPPNRRRSSGWLAYLLGS